MAHDWRLLSARCNLETPKDHNILLAKQRVLEDNSKMKHSKIQRGARVCPRGYAGVGFIGIHHPFCLRHFSEQISTVCGCFFFLKETYNFIDEFLSLSSGSKNQNIEKGVQGLTPVSPFPSWDPASSIP